MKGDPAIVDLLNQALGLELTAASEYFVESRMLSDWGFKKLAHGIWRDYAKAHRKNVRSFTDRVIFLEGTPVTAPAAFTPGDSVEAIFAAGLAAETAMHALYAQAEAACDTANDWVSEDLFQGILVKMERRIKKIETQIELIGSIGLELYMQEKI